MADSKKNYSRDLDSGRVSSPFSQTLLIWGEKKKTLNYNTLSQVWNQGKKFSVPMRGNLFIESPKETFDTLFLNILFLLILHLHGTIDMARKSWSCQEILESFRNSKHAHFTTFKKKKKIGRILILSKSVSPYVSLSHLFFLSFCWGIWKKYQVMKWSWCEAICSTWKDPLREKNWELDRVEMLTETNFHGSISFAQNNYP